LSRQTIKKNNIKVGLNIPLLLANMRQKKLFSGCISFNFKVQFVSYLNPYHL